MHRKKTTDGYNTDINIAYVLRKRLFAVKRIIKTGFVVAVLNGMFFSHALANEVVGSDGGSVSVGNAGQAVWSMPVEVPSGINGVAPNLTLSVSSSGGNGSLGVGGGLSGLSAISRCARTLHQDEYFQSPQYEQNDAYCLDGARLVLESGTYGASGSIYRTEIETFQRVKAHGAIAGKGPAYFEVTNRAGATMFYGQRANTQDIDAHSGAVTVWKIDQLIDSNTNTLRYHYADVSGNGEVYLTKITYGGNNAQNITEHLSVELIYEGRPDTVSAWSRGQELSQTKRIARIQTKVNATVVKEYKLTYSQGDVTGASRIISVQECAGNGDCYRPSTFEYAPEIQNDWVSSAQSLPSQSLTSDGKPLGMLADINNDGKSDWVSANISASGTQTINTYIGTLSGWQLNSNYTLPGPLYDYSQNDDGFAKGLLLDINGDGWPEYLQAYQTTTEQSIKTWRNTGNGFERDETLDLPVLLLSMDANGDVYSTAEITDLNSDGLVDLVQAVVLPDGQVDRQTWIHHENDGNHSWAISNAYRAPTIGIDYTQGSEGRVQASLQDMNGDGLSDWVESYRADGTTINNTWLNTGQGWQLSSQFTIPSVVAITNYDLHSKGVPEYTVMDVNADGLPDLVKAINLTRVGGSWEYDTWIHNGLGWQRDTTYNLPTLMTNVSSNGNISLYGGLIDLNGDGQPEFVRSLRIGASVVEKFYSFDSDTRTWSLSNDYHFPVINHHWQADGSSFATAEMADLDHDGFPELIDTLSGDVYVSSASQGNLYPGTLISTTNSLGAVTELTYSVTTDPMVYELSEQTPYPNVAYNAPAQVITQVSVSDGIGGMISAFHRYGKAKANLQGQGGLGYQYHALQDGNTGVGIITTFHQTYPFAGRIQASSKFLNDTLFSSSNSGIELVDISINGLTTQYPHPSSSVAETYDLQGNLLKITRSASQIDGYGNATVSTEEIFDATDTLVRRSTKTVEYKAPDLSRWLFGLPIKTTQTLFDQASGETYTNEATASFAADGKPISETLEPNSGQWVKKTYAYDGFGNRITSRVTAAGITGARISTTSFTADGRFPSTVGNTLGHTIHTEFDPIVGKPLMVKDANDITKEFLYDGFGTTLRETKAHQSSNATRGRQVVIPRFCDNTPNANCPVNAVYFIGAFDDQGEAPEIAYYDVNGKELRRQTYGFHSPEEEASGIVKVIVVDTEYDENGKRTKVTQPYYKDIETPTFTRYEYDILGREKKRINAAGNVFLTSYNGLVATTTNPGNANTGSQTTVITNNLFGQPVSSKDPDQNVTQYRYDGRGKLVETIDSAGNRATITYDPIFGRKIAMNDPDLGQWSYQYDSLGNLIAQTDAMGQTTTMVYDELNRLIQRTDDAGGDKEEITTWTYSNRNTDDQIIGGLQKVTSPNFERTLKYDNFSRVTEANSTIHAETFTQRTGYLGTADKVDWIQYPSGLAVRNTYDDYGFPKTVEDISLNLDSYYQFQAASEALNSAQRALEAWKDAHLTTAELEQLEEHEAQVRLLGKTLSAFYDQFEDDPQRQEQEDGADFYSGLVRKVQQKLTQHENWLGIYQAELDTRFDRIKPELDEIDELIELSKPHERTYNNTQPLYEEAVANAQPYADLINARNAHQQDIINDTQPHLQANIDSLHHHIRFAFISPYDEMYVADLDLFIHDLTNNADYITEHYIDTTNSEGALEVTFNAINQNLEDIALYSQRIQDAIDIINDESTEWHVQFNYWNSLAEGYAEILTAKAAIIANYSNQIQALNDTIQDDSQRIQNWLSPIVQSHNNILLSYNDRARAYVAEISRRTGSYAKREDLTIEKFLRPFTNHLNYVDCLRTEPNKTTGECYAENLVFEYDENGEIDEEKQAESRADVYDDTQLNVNQFYTTRRFFCSEYYGYSCSLEFEEEIKRLAKSIHAEQCARDDDPNESGVACALADLVSYGSNGDGYTLGDYDYETTVQVVLDYPFLAVSPIQDRAAFELDLQTKHITKVEQLVSEATYDTYNAETTFANIVQKGGNLWQPNPEADEPVLEGLSDPKDFVLIKKGIVQDLMDSQMSELAKQANRDLKGHQYSIYQLLESVQVDAYSNEYLVVQNRAIEAQRLYREIDQAYQDAKLAADTAAIENPDDPDLNQGFDEDEFDDNKKIYWQAKDINAKGQIALAQYGNNVTTEYGYDQFGRINSVFSKNADDQALLNQTYEFDAIGNLTRRVDAIEDVTEVFAYDQLNRLTQVDYSGAGASYVTKFGLNTVTYSYDELGNIIHKSDILGGGQYGTYTYGQPAPGQHAGPHAVTHISGLGDFTYDANGNQTSGNGRISEYSAYNKPTRITKDGKQTDLSYGPERQLIRQIEDTDNGQETTLYVGGLFEQISKPFETPVNRHHIAVAGNAIAVIDTEATAPTLATKENYLHKNHQGSVIVVSNEQGDVAERRYFDAFGDIKSYIGAAGQYAASFLAYGAASDLAFTGHRWLQSAAVVHMKGRVYDPLIARFMSADPHIQSPLNSQSLNRYAYVWNNPLSFTDPSGYFLSSIFKALKKLFKAIGKIIKSVLKAIKKVVRAIGKALKKIGQFIKKYARVIVSVVVAVAVPYAAAYLVGGATSFATATTWIANLGIGGAAAVGAVAGGLSGLVATGSLKGLLEGAIFGAITAGFAKYVTSSAATQVKNLGTGVLKLSAKEALVKSINFVRDVKLVLGHALIGGVRALYNGGKFLAGAITGGVSKLVTFGTNAINRLTESPILQGLVVATAGGLVSSLAGGSFELGFLTAGLAFAVNEGINRFANKRSPYLNPATGSSYNSKPNGRVSFDVRKGIAFGAKGGPGLVKLGGTLEFETDSIFENDIPVSRGGIALGPFEVEMIDGGILSSQVDMQFEMLGVDISDPSSLEIFGVTFCPIVGCVDIELELLPEEYFNYPPSGND